MPSKKRLRPDKIKRPVTPTVAEPATLKVRPQPVSQPARQAPQPLTPESARQLQRQIGNRAVGRFLNSAKPSVIQPKLLVGPANDKYEQEADQVSQQIMRRPGSAEAIPGRTVFSLQRVAGDAGFEAGSEVESRIAAQRGGGQPLPQNVRRQVEPRLGADFSGVRIHTDPEADVLNQSLKARAFTTGEDIFFRRGGYNPASAAGQELLAHELTHVVQQTQNGQTPQGSNAQPPAHLQTALDVNAPKQKEDEEAKRKAQEEENRRREEENRRAEEEARRRAEEAAVGRVPRG